jgi:hypothetical protein
MQFVWDFYYTTIHLNWPFLKQKRINSQAI